MSYAQAITFNGSENKNTVEVVCTEVEVTCSAGNHNHGSSKVQLDHCINYNWEVRYYPGQLIAVHRDGMYYAYSLTSKGLNRVRVTEKKSKRTTLIRDLKSVLDLTFALISNQVILAFVEEDGTASIYNIDDNTEELEATLLLQIIHPSHLTNPISNYKLIWCPYIPADGEDCHTEDDPAKLLAVINGSKVEVWDVSILTKNGAGPLAPGDYDGFLEVGRHSSNIIEALFSPDGTCAATACLDGYVRFFQLYEENKKNIHLLHEFKPHKTNELSCLFFLDDICENKTQFWKFLVTGVNYNREIKIWSCENWNCLQTINFLPSLEARTCELFFKIRLDMSGRYLVLSEINNRLLYVLILKKTHPDQYALVTYISEFLLPSQFLSFHITEAQFGKLQYSNSTEDLDQEYQDEYDYDLFEKVVVLKMFVIQPKQLDECMITFEPEASLTLDISQVKQLKKENNETVELTNLEDSVSLLLQNSQHHPQQLNLMTPDAFNSPGHNTSPHSAKNDETNTATLNKSIEKINENNIENLIDFERPQKDNFASGGSSPSREVQEILSLNKPSYFDNLTEITNENADQNDFNQTEDLLFTETINNEVVWPNIPIVKANEIVKEENRKQELRLSAGEDTEVTDDTKWNKAQLQTITFRMNSLENLVREQNVHIQKLQHEIKVLNKNQSSISVQELFAKELEVAMTKNQMHMAKMFENYVNLQKNKDRDVQDAIVTGISQLLVKQLSEKLQNIIVHEIKHVVLPAVLAVFENLKHQLDIQYSQKLNSTDMLLKDNISKLVTSKTIADSLSLSIVSVIKPSLEQCYKDMVGTTLIPSWERVCNTMFQQIHETFTQGTKEYTASVETYMDRQTRVQDKGKDLITQMQSVSESMKNNADKLTNNLVQEMHRLFTFSFNNMQDKLSRNIADAISEQIKHGFKSHAAVLEDSVINAVRSRAVTPSPHVIDSQVQLAHIKQLIAKGSLETAFQQALSASDLSLVTYVCEKVDVQDVFADNGCILQQPVLLSLIQQLSADLTHQTEMKHKYLEEAVLYLQSIHPVTNEHIPIILKDLARQLNIFIVSCPSSNKILKKMKMLLLVTTSLLQ